MANKAKKETNIFSQNILRIMFININRIMEKVHETLQLVTGRKIDIINLNEIKFTQRIKLTTSDITYLGMTDKQLVTGEVVTKY